MVRVSFEGGNFGFELFNELYEALFGGRVTADSKPPRLHNLRSQFCAMAAH